MRTGAGFLIVYAVTLRSSFEEVANFRDQILRAKDSDDIPIVIVGNKIDMESERKVSTEEGQDLAHKLGMCPVRRADVGEGVAKLLRGCR
jgi:GTPase KRas protein